MGMYDDYYPSHEIPCPACGTELITWQGREGPCDLLEYHQGHEMPNQGIGNRPVDPLEDGFIMTAYCRGCGAIVEASGVVMEGRWEGITDIKSNRT